MNLPTLNAADSLDEALFMTMTLGWHESAVQNGGGWATGFVQRIKGGQNKLFKKWLPAEGSAYEKALAAFLRTLLGNGRGAARVQISRALWAVEPEMLGRWAEHKPIIPASGGILRADLDIADGHGEQELRFPTMNEALKAIAEFRERNSWGGILRVYNSGGGLTVLARHPDAAALENRWCAAWEEIAAEGKWHIDIAACKGHGGIRLAGSERTGVRVVDDAAALDGALPTYLSIPADVKTVTGMMNVHLLAEPGFASPYTAEHDLPILTKDEEAERDAELGEAQGDRPGDRMATAIPASEYVMSVLGWGLEGNRLRQPGSTGADTAILAGEDGEVVFPHSGSDASALGIEAATAATSFALFAAQLGGDWSLAARIAKRYDGKWEALLTWVADNSDDLIDAAKADPDAAKKQERAERAERVKAFNALYTLAELGAPKGMFAKPSDVVRFHAKKNKLDPHRMMDALLDKKLTTTNAFATTQEGGV